MNPSFEDPSCTFYEFIVPHFKFKVVDFPVPKQTISGFQNLIIAKKLPNVKGVQTGAEAVYPP